MSLVEDISEGTSMELMVGLLKVGSSQGHRGRGKYLKM
jgi:hypothetical protein